MTDPQTQNEALARQDRYMRKGIELSKRAEEAARRANTQSSAISSDDPDAVAKLPGRIDRRLRNIR